MIVQKTQLLQTLKSVMSGVDGKGTLIGMDTFIFHNGSIFTCNDCISVMVPFEKCGLDGENIEGAVKAADFYNVVSKFSKEEIWLDLDDKTWIIKSGKAKAELPLLDFDYESRLKGIYSEEEGWFDIDDDFIEGLSVCKILNNESVAPGVFVKNKAIYSTDGRRLNKYSINSNVDLPLFRISDKVVNDLEKFSNMKRLQLQNGWAHFQVEDGTVFSVRTLSNDRDMTTSIENLINKSIPQSDEVHGFFPGEMLNAIDRANSFGIEMGGGYAVKLVVSTDGIQVSANRSSGKYEEFVDWDEPVKMQFEPVTLCVNIEFFEYMIKKSSEFYLQNLSNDKSKPTQRILFLTDKSVHMMATIIV